VATRKDEKIYGISGAAAYLSCDARTVRKYADSGQLPCTKDSIGRRLFKQADLEIFRRNTRARRPGQALYDESRPSAGGA